MREVIADMSDVSCETQAREGFVIYINWDGFAYEWYRLANEAYGGTPQLNRMLQDGVLFTGAQTGVPAITGAMQQCIASGAWPVDTGNTFRYYDADRNAVVQYARDNLLENVAEAAARNGVSLAAVNAWYFENRGTFAGDERRPYIQAPPLSGPLPGIFRSRVEAAIRIIEGKPVMTGDRIYRPESMPRFLSIYADDLDTVAHNVKVTYDGLEVARTRKQWQDNIIFTLQRMDEDLGRLVDALRKRGIYERTTIVLATDHGMVPVGADTAEPEPPYPPEACSSLPDLLRTVAAAGWPFIGRDYRVEALCRSGEQARANTEVVVTTVGLQAQIVFRLPFQREAADEIVRRLRFKPYYGAHLHREDLMRRGVPGHYADLVVSPKPPNHFRTDGQLKCVGGNHDSLDEQVQRVFLMIAGAGVKRGAVCDLPVSIVDIAPTIARLLGFEGPHGATGTALDEALDEAFRGPRLAVNCECTDKDAAEVRVVTEPGARLRANRLVVGTANSEGEFRFAFTLSPGMNRLVVEAEAAGRLTRRTLYLTVDAGRPGARQAEGGR